MPDRTMSRISLESVSIYLHYYFFLVDLMDRVHNPANRSISQSPKCRIQLYYLIILRDLIRDLFDNVAMRRATDAQLQDSLNSNIERLPEPSTATRNK